MSAPLLRIDDLGVSFVQYERGLHRRVVTALAGMHLTAGAGEVVALVGASGAGKSLLAHAVLGLLPPNVQESGTVVFDGAVVDQDARRRLAGRDIMLLPQSVVFLDPVAPIGRQVRRSARLGGLADPGRAAAQALQRRGLGPEVLRRYPHELSGGMIRQVLVAMATMSRPRLIFADEPTPGLQPAAARSILAEFRELADSGCAVILITHELRGALDIADRIVICHEGRTIEVADPRSFSGDGSQLAHPYSRALWQALPDNGFRVATEA